MQKVNFAYVLRYIYLYLGGSFITFFDLRNQLKLLAFTSITDKIKLRDPRQQCGYKIRTS